MDADTVIAAIEKVRELAPAYESDLQMLRRLVEQRVSFQDAGRIMADTMHGGKRAREVLALVEAELAGTDEQEPTTVRATRYCPGSDRPAQSWRNTAPLPEVQCPATTCQRFLVVPIGRTTTTPRHIFIGKAI